MSTEQNDKDTKVIGRKVKVCLIVIWSHLLYLTWIMLISGIHPIRQTLGLFTTIIVVYLQLVIMHDYLFIKVHCKNENFRKDIRIIEPLLPERIKKNDK